MSRIRRRVPARLALWGGLIACALVPGISLAQVIQNSATGSLGGAVVDTSQATVTLLRTSGGVDAVRSSVTADPAVVAADGAAVSTVTIVLRDAAGQPAAGKVVSVASDRGATDLITQPTLPTDDAGRATATVRSLTAGVATLTVTDVSDAVVLADRPSVAFTQGLVLQLTKVADRRKAVVGDLVTYLVEIRNTTANAVTSVRLEDQLPPNFKYRRTSLRIGGAAAPEPAGVRTMTMDLGTIPAWVDTDGSGRVDPGEPGYVSASYQVIVGSGATPGAYANSVVAKDVCSVCPISNVAEAGVTVTLDPVLDLGTIIGKVFDDVDRDGFQGREESGVPGAMVVLDDGTYVLTDEHGRYHFPAVRPGHRLLKIHLDQAGPGAMATTDEARIVSVTPGLLAKANFGMARAAPSVERIGREAQLGVSMVGSVTRRPMEVVGSVETLDVLINGRQGMTPTADVRVVVERLEDVIEVTGKGVERPIEFAVTAERPDEIDWWRLTVMDGAGRPVRVIEGRGRPPEMVSWDGRTESGEWVQGGEIYHYQVGLSYRDGGEATSARRLFGVNRTSAISLSLTGGVFLVGSATLGPQAQALLSDAAVRLRAYPHEKVVVEGHTDSQGSESTNLALSKARAESAVAYLVTQEQLPAERFVVRWFGSARPIATNRLAEGRELNRRVEVKGEVRDVQRSKLLDQYRTEPAARVDGRPVTILPDGRFSARVDGDPSRFDIEMIDAQGRSTRASVAVPLLDVWEPIGSLRAPDLEAGTGAGWRVTRLRGRTDPGNLVRMDGRDVPVDAEGRFEADLGLKAGKNSYSLRVETPAGYSRLATVLVHVSERDERGERIVAAEPIPRLSVILPPAGVPLSSPLLTVTGSTDPGHQVTINGAAAPVEADGRFVATTTLPPGVSRLHVEVVDPAGHRGVIEREVNVVSTRLFFLGFVDGKVGQLKGNGYLQGAGMEQATEFYSEGRAAYYLKGVVAGRYLITSAFDSGAAEFGRLFRNLDTVEEDRLLTNLDPDRLYPVYGDSSTVVYDAQSQGAFYLAVDGPTLDVLVGNGPVSLTENELAAYQRTVYGARVTYQSAARSPHGRADTELIVFGAEVRQAHIQDALRATGGSLYYLSRRDVIEGSERISIIIRDQRTGLLRSRTTQQANVDYTIRYPEGRVLFHRPIASVMEDASVVEPGLLSGHPVFIHVDYEIRVPSFEKTAVGGRGRREIGKRIAVGGTYVRDELASGAYELEGIDAEVRVGSDGRLVGEYASTTGRESSTFVSDDGGLTYTEVPAGSLTGEAWKLAGDVDAGEWAGVPDRIRLGGYATHLDDGFASNGTAAERGTGKQGMDLSVRVSSADRVVGRVDREARSDGGGSTLTSVRWAHDRDRWGLDAEYQARSLRSALGPVDDSSDGALRVRRRLGDRLTASVEHQQALSGVPLTRESLEVRYQAHPALALHAKGARGTLGEAVQAGAVFSSARGRAYLTERVSEDRIGRSVTTVLGGDAPIGTSTTVYSEYHWDRGARGDRAASLVGAQRHWDPIPGLRLTVSGEYGALDAGSAPVRRHTLTAGLSYTRPGWVLSTRDEVRRERGGRERVQYLSVNHIEWRVHPDVTVLATYRYSVTRDPVLGLVEAEFDERSLGAAYRPVAHDRFHALARYTRLSDRRPPASAGVATTADVASVEWSLQLARRVEWIEKEAAKIGRVTSLDRPPATTHTLLSIHRLNLTVWRALEWGIEYRSLRQREAADQRQGWLTEVMWRAAKHFRIGAGFNFTDFSDNEFSENDYSSSGWFVRAQGIY